MAISAILLHPGNRLLAGGTSDFAMFGGQPTAVSVGAPRVSDGGVVATERARKESDPNAATEADHPSTPLYTGHAPVSGDAESSALSHNLGVASNTVGQTAQPTGDAAGASAAHGSGSLNPFIAPTLFAAPQHAVGEGASDLAPATYGASFGHSLVNGSDAGVAGLLHSTASLTDSAIAQVDHLTHSALDTVGTLGSETLALADTTIGVVQGTVEATVLPLVDHLASGADLGSDLLAGVDPVGGIATLTAMVGSADVFEIAGHATAPLADAVTSTLDAVPDEGLLSPLLGEHHTDDATHHDGLLDGHGLGIGGL